MKENKLYAFIKNITGEGRTEAEYEEAVYNFEQYILIVKEIAVRLEREGKEMIDSEEDVV